MSWRFPWANANRIADDHRLEVAQIERQADRRAYRRADFTGGPCYLPPDVPLPVEDLRLKALVVRVIAYLGLAGVLTWALYFLSTSQVGQ